MHRCDTSTRNSSGLQSMAYKSPLDGLSALHVHAPLSSHDLRATRTNWLTTVGKKNQTNFSILLDTIRCTLYIFSLAWCPVCLCYPSQAKRFGPSLTQFPALNGAEGQMAQSAKSPVTIMLLRGLKIYIYLLHNEKVRLACIHVVPCLLSVVLL